MRGRETARNRHRKVYKEKEKVIVYKGRKKEDYDRLAHIDKLVTEIKYQMIIGDKNRTILNITNHKI